MSETLRNKLEAWMSEVVDNKNYTGYRIEKLRKYFRIDLILCNGQGSAYAFLNPTTGELKVAESYRKAGYVMAIL